MSTGDSEDSPEERPRPLFVTTHWSVVLAAKDKASPDCARALETLCQTYWYPLYAFVRGTGQSPHDAQDLTQSFLARLLEKDYLQVVTPEKGRFRTFLCMAFKRFLANERERLRSQKRGGSHPHVAFDTTMAEQRFSEERIDTHAPDLLYDRRWAFTLLSGAIERLEKEYTATGKAAEFHHLKPHLTAERGQIPYVEIASQMQTSEGAVRVALHRLRKRFREVFRDGVADTVAAPEELEAEIRHVLEVLSRG